MSYSVSSALYREAAARLADAIDGGSYFSGSVRFDFDGMSCCLRASVIVYRRRESLPEGEFRPIADLVPVWWEFHTVGEAGEVLNDFSFSELKAYFSPRRCCGTSRLGRGAARRSIFFQKPARRGAAQGVFAHFTNR